MENTMKAAIVRELGKPLIIEEVPIPRITDEQILVKIFASGVCHTDLHAINGDWPIKPNLPLIPGHEGAGEVVATGKNVKSVKVGQRVGIPWLHSACGECDFCLTGWETLCFSQENTGYSVSGCYAEYAVADPRYIAHLPRSLSFIESASILCAGLTVYKGIKETDTQPGDWIVISGIGGLGHMAIQYAKAMGLNVAAIDIHERPLELARRLQADIIINAALEDPVVRIQKEIQGAHAVLVTAVFPQTFSQAVDMLRRRGTVSLLGLPPGEFKLSIFDMVLNRKTVRGSIVGSRMDLKECLNFAAEGKVSVCYTVETLNNINTILNKMKNGQIQGRIVMQLAK